MIGAIYQGLERIGYEGGGTMLEPAMGVGNFFSCLPDSMRDSRLFGVELDSVTGRIAKQLYYCCRSGCFRPIPPQTAPPARGLPPP